MDKSMSHGRSTNLWVGRKPLRPLTVRLFSIIKHGNAAKFWARPKDVCWERWKQQKRHFSIRFIWVTHHIPQAYLTLLTKMQIKYCEDFVPLARFRQEVKRLRQANASGADLFNASRSSSKPCWRSFNRWISKLHLSSWNESASLKID